MAPIVALKGKHVLISLQVSPYAKIGGGGEHLFHTPDPRASRDARGRPLGARASRGQNARDARDRTLGARASREQNAREILGRPL